MSDSDPSLNPTPSLRDALSKRGQLPEGDGLSIGDLSQATGVSTHVLRIWERRYGAPQSKRRPSGHRRYPGSEVSRIRLVVQALEMGYRPRRVVSAPVEELLELMSLRVTQTPNSLIERWITATHQFDDAFLNQAMLNEWWSRGPLKFVSEVAAPFVERLGEAWRMKELDIAHEHFVAEKLYDFLSSQWRPLNSRMVSRPLVLATLPGEGHRMGLQFVAIVAMVARVKVVFLGADTPIEEIQAAARQVNALGVCISISRNLSRPRVIAQIEKLKKGLGESSILIAGGKGAPTEVGGFYHFNDFSSFHDWLIQIQKTIH